jgi:hypothetical protein
LLLAGRGAWPGMAVRVLQAAAGNDPGM